MQLIYIYSIQHIYIYIPATDQRGFSPDPAQLSRIRPGLMVSDKVCVQVFLSSQWSFAHKGIVLVLDLYRLHRTNTITTISLTFLQHNVLQSCIYPNHYVTEVINKEAYFQKLLYCINKNCEH